MPQQFGSANVWAQSQTPEGAVPSANPAQPAFFAGSACLVNASFFDTDDEPLQPNALSYRIDDVESGAQVLDWTPIAQLAVSVQIVVTAGQNALITNSRMQETHQVTFRVTDGTGGIGEPFCRFNLLELS